MSVLETYNQFVALSSANGLSDTVDIERKPDAIYVGVAGDVAVVMGAGAAVVLKALPVGWHRISPKRINATGTTATDLVAGYVR